MHNNIHFEDEEQLGFVIKLEGDLARVRVAPNAECDNCGTCNIEHMEILAYNAVNASLGQKIRFRKIEDNMIKIAFMMLMLPLLSIFAGLYAGYAAALYFNLNGTAMMSAGALIFLAAAVYTAYVYDKKYKLNKKSLPMIVGVVN